MNFLKVKKFNSKFTKFVFYNLYIMLLCKKTVRTVYVMIFQSNKSNDIEIYA